MQGEGHAIATASIVSTTDRVRTFNAFTTRTGVHKELGFGEVTHCFVYKRLMRVDSLYVILRDSEGLKPPGRQYILS